MNDIIILDDFLPSYISNSLEDLIYNSLDFVMSKSTAPPDSNYYDNNQIISWVVNNHFDKEGNIVNSNTFSHYFLLPLQIASLKLNKTFLFDDLLRVKVNVTFNDGTSLENKPNPPHLDIVGSKDNYFIGIYYVNESDGDTLIYEGNKKENLKLIKSISPKKGRLVLFNGNRYHSSSHPIKCDKRIIVNYNIVG